jgi:hypothetical protein
MLASAIERSTVDVVVLGGGYWNLRLPSSPDTGVTPYEFLVYPGTTGKDAILDMIGTYWVV